MRGRYPWGAYIVVGLALWLPTFGQSEGDQKKSVNPQAAELARFERALSPRDKKELLNLSALIGRFEPQEKIEAAWKALLSRAGNWNAKTAIDYVLDAAKREADRNVAEAKSRLQKLEDAKKAVQNDLVQARPLADRWKNGDQAETMVMTSYTVKTGSADPVQTRQGGKITSAEGMEKYVKELEGTLTTLSDTSQGASADLQNALKKQQRLVQMLSNISKMLSGIAQSSVRKIGG